MRAAMWWIDRWRQSDAFARMTAEEQGLYRNLCDEVVLREDGIIPDDPRILAKASGDHEAWARSGASVLKSMLKVEGGWTNETAMTVRKESERRAKKQAEYRSKRNSPGNADGNGNAYGNASGNAPDNRPLPPEQEQEKERITPVQPPSPPSVDSRSADDDARADLMAALSTLQASAEFRGMEAQAILNLPRFCAASGPVRLAGNPPDGLMRATAGKLRAYGRPAPAKLNGVPSWDRGIEHDVSEAELTAWDPRLGPRNAAEPNSGSAS